VNKCFFLIYRLLQRKTGDRLEVLIWDGRRIGRLGMRITRKLMVGSASFSVMLIAAGCTQSPLSSDLPRTPYGRYQDLRGGEPPQNEPDTFGNMRPALRARLEPMDRP